MVKHMPPSSSVGVGCIVATVIGSFFVAIGGVTVGGVTVSATAVRGVAVGGAVPSVVRSCRRQLFAS